LKTSKIIYIKLLDHEQITPDLEYFDVSKLFK